MTTFATRLVDADEVQRAFTLLADPGQIIEARILNAITTGGRYPATASGYFDNVSDLVRGLTAIREATGFYLTLNPCVPDLLARAHNRIRIGAKDTTADNHITRYRWLPIDIDPDRASGISSSNIEHDLALSRAQEIAASLARMGWPTPIYADSGNGAHLLYRVDLATQESDLVRRVLAGLADMFDIPGLHVDQKVFNPARIFKLYGTMACKGDDTAERPHRMAHILSAPETMQAVSKTALVSMAQPVEPEHTKSKSPNMRSFDIDAWISKHHLDVTEPKSWNGGRRWVFNICPWNSEHTDRSAYILQFPSGAIEAGCQHNGCNGKKWPDLRVIYEPDAYARNRASQKQAGPVRDQENTSEDTALPEIIIGPQLRITRDEALAAIEHADKKKQTIFVQLSKLAKVCKDKEGNPIIMHMGVPEVKNALTDSADFYKTRAIPNSEDVKLIPTSPSKEIAEQILALEPFKWPFSPLIAIVETPVLRPDGTILDTPGYDATTKLYYAQRENMKHCRVPQYPTRADVNKAVALLEDAIGEFPYEGQADKANMFATLLTPIVRPAISGDVQMALLNATKPGTGKGYLTHVVNIIATGKKASPLKLPDTEDELEKRLGSKLMAGTTMVIIDNITRKLQSAILELVLTCGGQTDIRILGQSKMVPAFNSATWIATGNNLQIGGDLARRCYQIRLVSPVSNPEERNDFKIKDLPSWAEEHRADLIVALLTLARAWYVAGKPQPKKVPSLASFTNWAKTIGGILEYAGIYGFQENRAELRAEANEEETQADAFLHAWNTYYGTSWIPAKTLVERIRQNAEDVAGSIAGSDEELPANLLAETLPDSLKNTMQDRNKNFTITLTKWLQKRIRTPYGADNIRIERDEDKHTKAKLWRVTRIVAGSSSHPSHVKTSEDKTSSREAVKDDSDIAMDEQTTRNYPHSEPDENTGSASSADTGHSTDFSPDGNVAGSDEELPANGRVYDAALADLAQKLQAQSERTGINPFWVEINGQPKKWKNGSIPVQEWVNRLSQCLYSGDVSLELNAHEVLEKKVHV